MKSVKFLCMAGFLAALIGMSGCVVERRVTPVAVEPNATGELIVKEPPPPPHEEVAIGVAPSSLHVWIPGYWAWHSRWVWVTGRWEIPPYHRAVWVPGHWQRRAYGWVWLPGHWRG
jgi:hypothetical protein